MQTRKKAITIECDSPPWLFYLYNLYIEVKGLACKARSRQSQPQFVIPASEARRESFFRQRKIPDKPE
jgi:hypothetical protein